MKIYLDACCLNRLTDDQSQRRIREEAEAIESIFSQARLGVIDLISSEALEEEARRIPSMDRRLAVEALLSLASSTVDVDEAVAQRARELSAAGYGLFDALHLAAAESAGADVLLSTDDGLIKRAARGDGDLRIPVRNPLSWSKEQG
ncbi:MAG: PIN domain-containing protein [Bryobacteraceae bacterium]